MSESKTMDQLSSTERLRESRKIMKLSRKQLATKIGKPTLWIRYIEEDMPDWKKTISVFELEKLCEALAITAFDIFAPIDEGYLTKNA